MKEKGFRLRPRYLVVAALLLLLLLSGAVGKYVQTIQHTGTVTFTASLAKEVLLQEHEAVRQDDGSYKLGETILPNGDKNGNTYTLIPGVDIPKDPHIVITGKTEIPAYLYIEIVDELESFEINGVQEKPVTYSVSSQWVATSTKTPDHGGTVYVYSTDGFTPFEFVTNTVPADPIYILAPISGSNPNTIEVSQHLKCDDNTRLSAGDLTFYAYLVEAASVDTP